MNNIVKVTIAILASAVALAVGVHHYKTSARVEPAHMTIARDRSDSILSDCGCTEALMSKALGAPNMGLGSTVTVIASGDETTADEPVLVAAFDVPTTRNVIEGRNGKNRKQEALLPELRTKCEALPVTKRSPIALLIRRGIERLRHSGCGPATIGCAVWVQTDGEETADVQLRKLFDGRRQSKQNAAGPLIDNDGVDIVFYGLSQTIGEREFGSGYRLRLTPERNIRRADILRQGWLAAFNDPSRVKFEPFCPIK